MDYSKWESFAKQRILNKKNKYARTKMATRIEKKVQTIEPLKNNNLLLLLLAANVMFLLNTIKE